VFRDTLLAFRLDLRERIAERIATVPGRSGFEYWPGDGSITFGDEPFGPVIALDAARDRVYVGAGDRYLIDERAVDGALIRRIVVCDEPEPVTDDQYDAYVAELLAGTRPTARLYEERAHANISRRQIAAAHADLFVDAVDRLWVRNLPMPGRRPVWRLFDSRGRWLGDIELPPNLELVDAGEDWALGRATDELDVESARLYRLIPGTR
jgi:hypothetical protein